MSVNTRCSHCQLPSTRMGWVFSAATGRQCIGKPTDVLTLASYEKARAEEDGSVMAYFDSGFWHLADPEAPTEHDLHKVYVT